MAIVPFTAAKAFSFEAQQMPERVFAFCDQTVRIRQAWEEGGKGGTTLGFGAVVQAAAFVLSKYLEANRQLVKGKTCLELGSGPGLVSIVSSLCGASKVLCTDGDDISVSLAASNAAPYGNVDAAKLLWGNAAQLKEIKPHIDVILASDVVACPYATAFDDLLSTFKFFRPAKVILAYKRRNASEERFFKMIEEEGITRKTLHFEEESGVTIYSFV